MRKLAISFDPHVWVNVHSGMEVSFIEVSANIHCWLLSIVQVLFAFKKFYINNLSTVYPRL